MSKPAGFGRHSSSDSVPGTSATINTPERIAPDAQGIAHQQKGSAPDYPSNYPTGPSGVEGDVR